MKSTDIINKYSSSFTIRGDWNFLTLQLKKDFQELTEADLLFERGRERTNYQTGIEIE